MQKYSLMIILLFLIEHLKKVWLIGVKKKKHEIEMVVIFVCYKRNVLFRIQDYEKIKKYSWVEIKLPEISLKFCFIKNTITLKISDMLIILFLIWVIWLGAEKFMDWLRKPLHSKFDICTCCSSIKQFLSLFLPNLCRHCYHT